MPLTQFQTTDMDMSLMQNSWAKQLDPVIANPLLKGNILKDITLGTGNNSINHKLQRAYQGYIITNMKGAFAQIYSNTSTTPSLTLVLNASAPTTIDLLVY